MHLKAGSAIYYIQAEKLSVKKDVDKYCRLCLLWIEQSLFYEKTMGPEPLSMCPPLPELHQLQEVKLTFPIRGNRVQK